MRTLFTTIAFLSRLPVPQRWQIAHDGDFSRLPSYFPAAGAAIGVFNAAIAAGLIFVFPPQIAVALLCLIIVAIAGAFHEDGFADVADAMGAYTIERRFEIMKDPRLGTFGVSALICLFFIRFTTYLRILESDSGLLQLLILIVLTAASMRWASVTLLQVLPYTHGPGKGIGKSLQRPGWPLLALYFISLTAAWGIWRLDFLWSFLTAAILTLPLCYWFFKRNFGGANGDCLGASAIVFEILLLSIACSWIG